MLWAGAALGWWLVGRYADPLLERCRAAGEGERILRAAAISDRAWQHRRLLHRRRRSARRLHDLDGRPLLLREDEIEDFRRRCRQELGLTGAGSWPEVRRHWRRRSLEWHPDRGGDRQAWLRRQRAYEALKLLREQSAPAPLGMPPQALLPRRPRFLWSPSPLWRLRR